MATKSTTSASPEKDEAIAVAGATATEPRNEVATKLVDRFAVWSGVAGLLPIPVVDLVVVAGLQLQMLRRVSQIYEVPFSENRGKALITSLLGAMIPTSSGLGMADALKAIPVVG